MKNTEKKNFVETLVENREFIYPALFYIAGLLLGAFSFKIINNTALSKLIELALKSSSSDFSAVFFNRFSLYISLYALCVLLGMCLIGFPLINAVPLLLGTEIAIKTAYCYISYSVKGVGYSLLMIIPQGAAVVTVLIYAIKTSTALSRSIYVIAAKGSLERVDIRHYLKKYLIYGFIIALISLLNAAAVFLIGGIVKMQ